MILNLKVFVVAVTALTVSLPATAKEPTAKEILKSASKHFEIIADYKADIKVSVEAPKLHMPEMNATMYYKRPDKLHIETKEGFAMLPKQGVMIGNPLTDLLSAKNVDLIRSEKVLDFDCYVIKGSFVKDDCAVESTVWIDKKERLLRQMRVDPEWGASIWVKVWYTKVGRKYWMPSSTSAQVSLPPMPGSRAEEEPVKGQPTVVNMKFSNYKVNTGLSDKIFRQSPKKK